MKDVRRLLGRVSTAAKHRLRMRRALTQLKVSRATLPDDAELQGLARAWGGLGYEADPDYLRATIRLARESRASILECGTGLTTLVLALYSERPVISLEQHAPSRRKVQRCLKILGASNPTVVATEIRSHGDWAWYDWTPSRDDRFDLVICDGPPGDTVGGRFGLMPAVAASLAPGAIVLLDDARRESESAALRRWIDEFGMHIEGLEAGSRFAELRAPGPRPASGVDADS
jgi:predicted O-methyltransferase YrrM